MGDTLEVVHNAEEGEGDSIPEGKCMGKVVRMDKQVDMRADKQEDRDNYKDTKDGLVETVGKDMGIGRVADKASTREEKNETLFDQVKGRHKEVVDRMEEVLDNRVALEVRNRRVLTESAMAEEEDSVQQEEFQTRSLQVE